MRHLRWPLAASLAVTIVPPILILATGLVFWDLVLIFALFAILWPVTRMSRQEIGLRIGSIRDWGFSVVYPLLAIGVVAVAALAFGAIDPTKTAGEVGKGLLVLFFATFLGALLTEEGFFRGWLWGSLERAGLGATAIVIWTSVVFCLWHVPTATIQPDFQPPPGVVPLYLSNVMILGLTWALLRAISGSIVVTSACHAVWNALTYQFFGYGIKIGGLGIESFSVFDPERGVLGLAVNLVILISLWVWWRKREAPEPRDRVASVAPAARTV